MSQINYPKETSFSLNIESFHKGINTSKDENITSFDYATNLYNFSFDSGILKTGLGFNNLLSEILTENEYKNISNEFESIGSIEKIFHFYLYNQETLTRDDKLIFINSEQKFYYINLFDNDRKLNFLRNIYFSSSPSALRYRLNGQDVMIFSSTTDNMVVWDGYNEPYEVLDAPKISSMCLHYERLFATVDGEKNSIWFSDDLDPTNWSLSLDEAGFIELIDERGALLKVVSFCDYIYIFREHGISRLSAYGNHENFSVSNLFVSTGEIYADSVCVCGDEIIFLASDGLYKFDGVSTVKILTNIENNISNIKTQKATSCYYNGKYYLACKFKFDEDLEDCENSFYSNSLLEIDINSHKLLNLTHDVNFKFLTSITSEKLEGIIAITNNKNKVNFQPTLINSSGKYLNYPLQKIWASPTSGLNDTYKLKTLKKISIQTETDIFITIYHDEYESKLYFKGSNFPTTKRTNLQCNTFKFKIEAPKAEANIKNLKFDFISTDGRL